jgi:putative transcriptional regulator
MQMSNQMIMKGGDIMRINRELFAAALARMDLNGNQLAAKAGVSRGTVTAVKTGKSCSPETAEKLAAVLGREIIEKEANK